MNERMSLESFGAQLLETEDLDPIYVVLHRANLNRDQLRRWLLAYWCFYHAGVASWLSERPTSDRYWAAMLQAAYNDIPSPAGGRWPRGRERRHFRGDKAANAVARLAAWYPYPEEAVRALEFTGTARFSLISQKVQQWPMFGPWIAFKVADMLERVLGVPIDFSGSDVFFFDSPREAAIGWYEVKTGIRALTNTGPGSLHDPVSEACSHLERSLQSYLAPPRYDRKLGLQEFETILCKWKSHMNGHYPVGNDIHELHEALSQWKTVSATAQKLLIQPMGGYGKLADRD